MYTVEFKSRINGVTSHGGKKYIALNSFYDWSCLSQGMLSFF